ncbi:MAG: MATE family efflux transporter, partial [Clostridia bacterium]|nr:MATE family efflux transporter [Clostridia bacterium]
MAAKKPLNITDGSRSVPMTIILLAWPVFIEQVFTTLVSFADTAMVGSLGKEATAAISISNSPIFLLNGVIMALGIGLTTMVAHAVGSGDHNRVKSLMRHAFLVVLYIGIPISVLVAALSRAIPLWMGAGPDIIDAATNYNLIVSAGRIFMLASMTLNSAFRGYGDTKTPMILNIIMNVVNVVGNFLLIYPTRTISVLGIELKMIGAGWGVEGAAAATALGMAVSGILALVVAFKKSNPYHVAVSGVMDLKPDKELTSQIFKISLPAMLERIFMSSSGIIVSSSLATLG